MQDDTKQIEEVMAKCTAKNNHNNHNNHNRSQRCHRPVLVLFNMQAVGLGGGLEFHVVVIAVAANVLNV